MTEKSLEKQIYELTKRLADICALESVLIPVCSVCAELDKVAKQVGELEEM